MNETHVIAESEAGPATAREARGPAWPGLLLTALAALPALVHAGANTPTVQLFPSTVLEDIKHTGNVAREMETDLQDVISRLDEQTRLFEQSNCEGNDLDPGCSRIAKQLGATYLEMLDIMGERLPEMEAAVRNTHSSLERRLRGELGQKMTPWELQEMLLAEGPPTRGRDASRPNLRGRSGLRLSDRFRQYYELVSHPATKTNNSLAVIASDIYLDMRETSDLIALTRQEISRTTLMEELNQSLGIITPEMQDVVAGVKSILFGEAAPAVSIAGPPPSRTGGAYRSPLQL